MITIGRLNLNYLQFQKLKISSKNYFCIRIHRICLTLVILVLVLNCHIWSSALSPECKTRECSRLGIVYKMNMNEQVNPCSDFYNYVCQNWGIHNPKPPYYSKWDAYMSMDLRTKEKLKTALEDRTVSHSKEVELIKQLYRTFMGFTALGRGDGDFVKKYLDQSGAWPLFLTPRTTEPSVPWTKIQNQYTLIGSETSLFSTSLAIMSSEPKIVLMLTRLKTPYGSLFRVNEWKKGGRHYENYKKALKLMIANVEPIRSRSLGNVIDQDLDDVLEFRILLERISKDCITSNFDGFGMMPIKDFQELYNKYSQLVHSEKINWLELIRSMYNNHFDVKKGTTVEINTQIIVYLDYFTKLAQLLGQTRNRTIVNHIQLYFIERQLLYSPITMNYLEKSYNNYPTQTGLVRYAKPRWLDFMNDRNEDKIFGKIYISAFFPEHIKNEVTQLFDESKELMKLEVLRSNWLDNEMKSILIQKMNGVTAQFGFPDWYRTKWLKKLGIPINSVKTEYDVDPLKLDAFYLDNLNKIFMSANYFQRPVFIPNVPYVIKYGSTVSVLAHELFHAFNGIRNGSTTGISNVWPTRIHAEYVKQKTCIKDLYNFYKKIEYQKLGVNMTNTVTTILEDAADLVGLKISFMGYRQKLEKMNGKCEVLAGFKNFSCDQMFFISYANLFCSDLLPEVARSQTKTDSHSLPNIRVNAGLANMKEFSDAFGCRIADFLNPPIKCDFWIK